MKFIHSHESRLEGIWVKIDGKVVADETAQRIEELIKSDLTELSVSEDGWETLYVDNRDGRKWKLTYPHKEWHGGGPPTLTLEMDDYSQAKNRE
jgi:hypothetical protein